jgi:hypothetical protein
VQREAVLNKSLYEAILQKIKETDIASRWRAYLIIRATTRSVASRPAKSLACAAHLNGATPKAPELREINSSAPVALGAGIDPSFHAVRRGEKLVQRFGGN